MRFQPQRAAKPRRSTAETPWGITPWRFQRWAPGLLLACLGLGCFSLRLPIPQHDLLVNCCTELLFLIATGVFVRSARGGGPHRRFHQFMAMALAFQALLGWVKLMPGLGLSGFLRHPQTWFACNLIGFVLQGLAVIAWPTPKPKLGLCWREVLDTLLFTSSLFLVFWLTGLGHLLGGALLPRFVLLAQLSFFLNSILLMGLALFRGFHTYDRFNSALGWLVVSFFLRGIGNLAWLTLFLHGRYHSGHPIDAVQPLIPALYLLAALCPNQAATGEQSPYPGLGRILLPYLPAMAALPMLLSRLVHPSQAPDPVACYLGTLLVILAQIRFVLALRDAQDVSRSLERQIQDRTRALEESQGLLLKTQRLNLMATLGAGLAHDLNNLLAVVQNASGLLEEDLQAEPATRARHLHLLNGAAHRAGELVQKLLSFGRGGASQPAVFELRKAMQGMAKLLTRLAGASIQVHWELGTEPLRVELDVTQVEQIVVNLVVNARDAMPNGGSLWIRLQRCSVQPTAFLSITDTGPGISEPTLSQLFDPFFTTKAPGQGTGLGLASVKAITEACGASIEVATTLGTGTTFKIGFPLVDLA